MGRLSLLGRWAEPPPHQPKILLIPLPPSIIPPVDSPLTKFLFPPLNTTFMLYPIKTLFLAVVIAPVPFLFQLHAPYTHKSC